MTLVKRQPDNVQSTIQQDLWDGVVEAEGDTSITFHAAFTVCDPCTIGKCSVLYYLSSIILYANDVSHYTGVFALKKMLCCLKVGLPVF